MRAWRGRRYRRSRWAPVVLAVTAVSCAATDEARIERRLDELTQAASIEDRETPMIREARARMLGAMLAPDVDVDLGAPFTPVAGQDAVIRMATQVRVPSGGVRVGVEQVRVTVDEPTRRAIASLTARLEYGEEVGGDLIATRALDVVFSEIGGEWLVQRVRPTAR